MLNTLLKIFVSAGKALLVMFVSEKMIIWAMELAAKQTKTKVDDYLVALVRAAYENDVDKVKAAIELLADKYKVHQSISKDPG